MYLDVGFQSMWRLRFARLVSCFSACSRECLKGACTSPVGDGGLVDVCGVYVLWVGPGSHL